MIFLRVINRLVFALDTLIFFAVGNEAVNEMSFITHGFASCAEHRTHRLKTILEHKLQSIAWYAVS